MKMKTFIRDPAADQNQTINFLNLFNIKLVN